MTATASATVTMTDPRQSDSRTPERGLYLRRAWRRGGGAKPLIGRHCNRSNQSIVGYLNQRVEQRVDLKNPLIGVGRSINGTGNPSQPHPRSIEPHTVKEDNHCIQWIPSISISTNLSYLGMLRCIPFLFFKSCTAS